MSATAGPNDRLSCQRQNNVSETCDVFAMSPVQLACEVSSCASIKALS